MTNDSTPRVFPEFSLARLLKTVFELKPDARESVSRVTAKIIRESSNSTAGNPAPGRSRRGDTASALNGFFLHLHHYLVATQECWRKRGVVIRHL